MTSTFRWYLLGLLALFGAYVALEYYRPKPVDWRPTLINKDKIPYGTYVLYDQLPRLLGTDSVQTTRLPIYNQLTGLSLEETDMLAESQARTITTEATQEPAADSTATSSDSTSSETTSSTPDSDSETDSDATTTASTNTPAASEGNADADETTAMDSTAQNENSDDEEEPEHDWVEEHLRQA
ncbi:hypothetical protein AAFH49_20480, partial [Hymenobacter segetis]